VEPFQQPPDREVILHDQGRGFDQPPDDPGVDQVIRSRGVPSAEQAGSLSIQIRTHLWVSWARVAITHEAVALAARKPAQQPGANLSLVLEREGDAGLVGICAAAFALEALSRELEELGLLPAATVAAWGTMGRPDAAAATLEVLKVSVDPKGMVNLWKQELSWLFQIRGASVHYQGSFQPPQPHPLGTNVAPSQITYSAENTTRAVDLLLGILEQCRDRPKPGARQWSQEAQGIITQLIGSRGQGPQLRGRVAVPRRCGVLCRRRDRGPTVSW
jgi:hypothetical protein